jgi:DNA-binding XRE family transcriptional regulator
MDSINKRIELIIKELNYNKNSFAKAIGLTANTIIENIVGKRQSKPSFDVLHKILVTFPHLDANWLMTGEGEMYKVVDEKVLERRLGNMDAVLRGHDKKIEEYEERIKALEQQFSGQ